MNRIPFSVYDFFGYLASGFIVLAGLTYAFVGRELLGETPSLLKGFALLIATYVTGQIVANLAGYILESVIVGRLLGTSTLALFGRTQSRLRFLFPGYYRGLPTETQERVLQRAKTKAGITEPGEGLFLHCHATVKTIPAVLERLNSFLNLYGFCRNGSLALGVAASALAISIAIDAAPAPGRVSPTWLAVGAALAAIGMFYRYLKFLRQYAYEVYASYAEAS